MKKRITNLVALSLLVAFGATAQIQTPAPSPAGSVYSKVGLTDVTIEYSRPKVKGRKIFGEGSDFLQPYGQLWRAGANQGSKLTISTDANIGGVDVKAGTYMIYATPGADNFSFKLYSDLTLGGNVNGYDTKNEILSVDAKATKLGMSVEALTYNIADLSEDGTMANIELAWADVSVKVPITVNFDDAVMADIATKTQVNPQNYIAAANYYMATDKDLNKALEWMNMYLAAGENSEQFWNVHSKAQILAKMGKKKEAIATAEDSLEKAKKSERGDFGYIKRNEDLIAELKSKK